MARTVEGKSGVLHVDQLRGLIRPENDHLVRTRLVCLENTHNRGRGQDSADRKRRRHLRLGPRKRLADSSRRRATVECGAATGIPEAEWSKHFDTVSVCFSKGLGVPVGSALAGTKDAIKEARRHRKLFGGGMRQVGIIAAGHLYALQHNRQRLSQDHANAQILAEAIRAAEGLSLQPDTVETNIVIFRVDPKLGTAAEFVAELKVAGVLCLAISPTQIRFVTHLDVNEAQCRQAAKVVRETVGRLASGKKAAKELEPAYYAIGGLPRRAT